MTDSVSSWINTADTIHTWSDLAGLVENCRANRWIFRGVHDASQMARLRRRFQLKQRLMRWMRPLSS